MSIDPNAPKWPQDAEGHDLSGDRLAHAASADVVLRNVERWNAILKLVPAVGEYLGAERGDESPGRRKLRAAYNAARKRK